MDPVRVEELTYRYPLGEVALEKVSLSIPRGIIAAFVGPNGAGKSTFFWHLNGLYRPAAGEIWIEGVPVSRWDLKELRRQVGLVFQEPDDQLFSPTVGQEVAFGLQNRGYDPGRIAAEVRWALEVVGMAGVERRSPHHLSGGEKKRVAIAAVLALRPRILVLDEPTSGMDPEGVESLMRLLRRIRDEFGTTILYSTHDMDLVPELADRVYLLYRGRLAGEGDPSEVLTRPDLLQSAGLREPRLGALVRGLREDGFLGSLEGTPLTVADARRALRPYMREGSGRERR